jgi:hypothetical protein
MPNLSFDEGKDGRAIAIVRGGANDGDVMYLHEEESKGRRPKATFNKTKYTKAFPGMKMAERTKAFARIEEALNLGHPDTYFESEPHMKTVYQQILADSSKNTVIELDDSGLFELLPNPDPKKREVYYITGQSGSGKSFIAKQYADYYHKLFPSRGVYLISKLQKDETLDKLKFLKRVDIDSLVDDYPELDEFNDCLVIFDDYNTLTKDQEKAVLKLIDDLAIMGRHSVTSMMVLTHHTTNYKQTRLILNECTNIVVFPQSTSSHALKHLLVSYVGVDEKDLKRYKKLGSRWLMFSKNYPSFMVSQRDAELLHQRE